MGTVYNVAWSLPVSIPIVCRMRGGHLTLPVQVHQRWAWRVGGVAALLLSGPEGSSRTHQRGNEEVRGAG